MALCSIAIAAGIVGVVAVVKRLVFRRRFGHLAFAGGPCGGGPGSRTAAMGRRGRRAFVWQWSGFRRSAVGTRLPQLGPRRSPWRHRRELLAPHALHAARHDARSGARDPRRHRGAPRSRQGREVRHARDAESLGKSVAGETFDDAAFEAVSARVDAHVGKMKDALSSALKRVHAVLDPKQRERLADLVSKGAFGRWGRGGGGGPYRDQ